MRLFVLGGELRAQKGIEIYFRKTFSTWNFPVVMGITKFQAFDLTNKK